MKSDRNINLRRYAPWSLAALCLAACAGFMLYHHSVTGWWAFYMPDTQSYIFDGFTIRQPVYPLFLRACGISTEMGDPVMITVSLIPALIYPLSVAAFTRIALTYGLRSGLAVSAVYALFPSLTILPLEMGSECMAVSFVVITVYLFWQLIQEPTSVMYWGGLTLMALALIGLRPSFVYVPVALAVVALLVRFVARDREYRRLSLKLLISAAVVVVYIMAYSAGVYCKWGVFTPSTISLRNDYYETRVSGVIDASCCSDSQLKIALDSILAEPYNPAAYSYTWQEAVDLTNDYDMAALRTTIVRSKQLHSEAWRAYFVKKNVEGLSESLFYPGTDKGDFAEYEFRADIGRFMTSVGLTWWLPAAAALAMALILTRRIRRCRRMQSSEPQIVVKLLTTSLLTLLILGNIAIVALGAPYDYSRLLIPSLAPFLLLLPTFKS